jgi:hypothetical protein
MGSKVNPTILGAFVVSAVVLVVAGGLFFGGGKFFEVKARTVSCSIPGRGRQMAITRSPWM